MKDEKLQKNKLERKLGKKIQKLKKNWKKIQKFPKQNDAFYGNRGEKKEF